MEKYYITKDLVGGGCLHYLSTLIYDESKQLLFKSYTSRRSDAFIFTDYSYAVNCLDILNGLPENVRKGFNINGEEITLYFEYKIHKCRK